MAIHILKSEPRVSRRFELQHSCLSWLRRSLRLRAREQQQPASAFTPTMEALYVLALAVVDEHGLD